MQSSVASSNTAGNEVNIIWKVDKISTIAEGARIGSPVATASGLTWQLLAARMNQGLQLCVSCVGEGYWTCETRVTTITVHVGGNHHKQTSSITFRGSDVDGCNVGLFFIQPEHIFYSNEKRTVYCNKCAELDSVFKSCLVGYSGFVYNDAVEIRVKIEVQKTSGVEKDLLPDFSAPDSMSDITLIVQDHKLHVSKHILAVHSPVFEAMFFKKFAESQKDEVELEEIEHKDFLAVLRVIYPPQAEITRTTFKSILTLADRFEMKVVIRRVEEFLIKSNCCCVPAKLLFADNYRLTLLRDYSLASCDVSSITALKQTEQYQQYSDALKAAICDRLINLCS